MTRLREVNHKIKQIQIEKKHFHPKILSCQVNQEELTVKLEDERKITLPLNLLFSQWFLRNDIKPEQLKSYKIWGGGNTIIFPEIDESIPVRIFEKGINSDCCC